MRKWLSSLGYILAVLVIIFLLLPLLMGFLAEKKCNQLAEIISNTTPFNIKVTAYQRGWFNADATAQITLNKSDLPNQQLYELAITTHIVHGPILIDWKRCHFLQALINADINLNAEQNNLLKRANNAGAIATVQIKCNLSGNTTMRLASPPLAYQDLENSLLWHGLKAEADFSPLGNKIRSEVEFSGVNLNTKNFNFNLGKLTSIYQGSKTNKDSWTGERSLQLESFNIKNENNRTTALHGLSLHNLITDNHKDSVNVATTITIDNLKLNDTTYNKNNLDFEISELNQDLLNKLQKQLTSIPPTTNIGLDIIPAILNGGNEINVKQLTANTPWGKLLAAVKITLSKQPNNNSVLATITGSTISTDIKTERALALHLLEKFYKNIPSSSPTNPTVLAEKLLNSWQQSGTVITSNQDSYLHLALDYKNGQLLINNKQLTLTTKP